MEDSSAAVAAAHPICLFDLLPTELLTRIFLAIPDARTLTRSSSICHRWHSIIEDPTTDNILWYNLCLSLCGCHVLPQGRDGLSQGSLVAGTYNASEQRWRYRYKDLYKNAFTYSQIPFHKVGTKNRQVPAIDVHLQPAHSLLPQLQADAKRIFDVVHTATEGMRVHHASPFLSTKLPNFSDALAPGETAVGDTAWMGFSDNPAIIDRFHHREIEDAKLATAFTIQRAVLRADKNGVLGDGSWGTENMSKAVDENVADADDDKSKKRKRWRVFARGQKRTKAEADRSRMDGDSSGKATSSTLSADDRSPSPFIPEYPSKWIRPVDSGHMVNARRWDASRSMMVSIVRDVGSPERKTANFSMAFKDVEHLLRNIIHSDANLRLVPRKTIDGPAIIEIYQVDRLALPVENVLESTKHMGEPEPVVNKTWNLFRGAHWSLNRVPPPEHLEDESLKEDFYNLSSRANHTWEFRSCGDYLIVSDDVSGSQPCTISCFRANAHALPSRKLDLNTPEGYNRSFADCSSDLLWQRRLIKTFTEEESKMKFFYDNDGLAMTSRCVIYATRKRSQYILRHGRLLLGEEERLAEFHVISLETGETLRILSLDNERHLVDGWWCGWTSFAVTDTHLVASIGGTATHSEDDTTGLNTWSTRSRSGREEIFIWPLDGDQALGTTLAPTGRLAVGFNKFSWWAMRDKYIAISRDGRYVCVTFDWMMAVWDIWNHAELVGIFEAADSGQPSNIVGPFKNPPRDGDIDNLPWNALWLTYRDITSSGVVLDHGVVHIHNRRLRTLINGAEKNPELDDRYNSLVRHVADTEGWMREDDSDFEPDDEDMLSASSGDIYDDDEEEEGLEAEDDLDGLDWEDSDDTWMDAHVNQLHENIEPGMMEDTITRLEGQLDAVSETVVDAGSNLIERLMSGIEPQGALGDFMDRLRRLNGDEGSSS